jgi:HK97 family phage major capsid protein
MSDETKAAIEQLNRAWEEFKSNNDQSIEAKAKGAADVLFDVKAAKINEALDGLADSVRKLEAKAARPGAGAEGQRNEDVEHRSAFARFMTKGDDTGLSELEMKSLQTTVPADGGYAVPKVIDTEIVKKLVDISPIRSIAQVVQVGTSDFNKLADIGGTQSGWVGETAARPATNTPTLANIKPTMGELYANPQATQVMLDDVMFNAEAWLAASVAEEFARAEGAAFISGDGTNKPTGFLNGTPVATADSARAWGVLQYVASAQAAALPTSADIFIDMVQALKAGYRQGSAWVTSKATLAGLRKYKDTTNQYLWQPSVQAGMPSQFLGFPVIEAEDMPTVGAGNFPLAFGNFSAGYLIVDRMGTRVLRDPYSNKPFVGFYTTKRVGGILQNSEAIKVLKIAAS